MTEGLIDPPQQSDLIERLRRSEALLHAAGRLGRLGAWAYEVASQQLIWSDEVRAIHEVDADYVPDITSGIAFYAAADQARIGALVQACITTGRPFDDEFILTTARGRQRRVRSIGHAVLGPGDKVVRVEGAFQDISEQYERNRRLSESEATLAAVFSQSYVYQGILDAQGRLTMANQIAFTACGYQEAEEVGRPFWECSWWRADPALVEQIRAIIGRALAGETVTQDLDYFVASNERRQTQFSALPIHLDNGRALSVLVSGIDITERKRSEVFHAGLRSLLEQIAVRRPLEDNLLGIMALIETQFPHKYASINLLTADGRCIGRSLSPSLPQEYSHQLEGVPIGPQAGSCGTAAYERRMVIVSDIGNDPLWASYRELVQPYGLASCWSLPIFDVHGRVLGTFAIYGDAPSAPAPGELELVADCAHIAGIAIERAEAEVETRRLNRALQMRSACSERLISAVEESGLLSDICEMCVSSGGYRMAWVGYARDDDFRTLEMVAHHGNVSHLSALRLSWSAAEPIGHGPAGRSVREGRAIVVEDVNTDPDFSPWRAAASVIGYRCIICLPLSHGGETLGMLGLYAGEPRHISEDEITLLQQTADNLAFGITNLRARRSAELQLREQASLLDKAHDAIIVRALDNRILFWNQGAERLYGWSNVEAVGQHIDRLLYRDTSIFQEGTRKVLELGEWQGEVEQFDKSGQTLCIEAHWSLVCDDDGQPRSILAINTDISQRKASEREIYTLAFHDSLTGLPNRQLLHNRLDQALIANARDHVHGAILFLDLDNFKALNDTQGHDVGDKLLVKVAQRLNLCVRESDTVARIGGDEFVVMLATLGNQRADAATQAQAVAKKIVEAFAQPFDLDGFEYSSTPSLGVALFSDTQLTVEELLKRADLAMYQAKAAGRNTIRFFDPEMQAAVSLRVQMESDLRRGLQRGEFVLYYQAQVDAEGRLTGVEALVRWQHPLHGLMSPFNFIPVAEDSGLILPIGVWILETACHQLAAWAQEPDREALSIAVNVSARQFRHADFVSQVQAALERTGADPQRLKLELTESQLVDNVEETIDKMQALRRLGVSFSLDDFGTGYSSLSYLKRLPLAQLKIDPSFVRDILDNPSDAAIARTVIALGHSLGLNVIAEGVETEAQRALLYQLGCHSYQGYLFSRPVPIEELETLDLADMRVAVR